MVIQSNFLTITTQLIAGLLKAYNDSEVFVSRMCLVWQC